VGGGSEVMVGKRERETKKERVRENESKRE